MLPPKDCEACYLPFQPSRKERRFCSKRCKGKVQSVVRRILPDLSCEECGMLFRPESLKRRFCSSVCFGQYWRRICEQDHPRRKNPEIPCPVCGKVFHLVHMRRKTCSKACAREMHRGPQPQRRKLQPLICPGCNTEFQPKNRY